MIYSLTVTSLINAKLGKKRHSCFATTHCWRPLKNNKKYHKRTFVTRTHNKGNNEKKKVNIYTPLDNKTNAFLAQFRFSSDKQNRRGRTNKKGPIDLFAAIYFEAYP